MRNMELIRYLKELALMIPLAPKNAVILTVMIGILGLSNMEYVIDNPLVRFTSRGGIHCIVQLK